MARGEGREETNEFVSVDVLVGPREQGHSSVVEGVKNENDRSQGEGTMRSLEGRTKGDGSLITIRDQRPRLPT